MKRLYNLDYLRGIAAFSIMIYHYLMWTNGEFPADTVMARIGLYGVSIFYILSGLTLYYVYNQKMTPTKDQFWSFAKKRFYRIFPLLWLVTFLSIVVSLKVPEPAKLILNLTGLFGFFDWANYYATGAWSIGNELVFYAFFPIFILLANKSRILFILFSLLIFLIFVLFAFKYIDQSGTVSTQWSLYVNPLNQVFLFLSGFLMGYIFKGVQLKNSYLLALMVISILTFIYYPVEGGTLGLVTGFNRLLFSLLCFVICLGFFKVSFTVPNIVHKPLVFLGEASYSVYLLHPVVYKSFKIIDYKVISLSDSTLVTLSIIVSLVASYFVYEYYEKYFVKLGKKADVIARKESITI